MDSYNTIIVITAMKKAMAAGENDKAYHLVQKVNLRQVSKVLDLLTVADVCAGTKHYEEAKAWYKKAYVRTGSKRSLSQLVYMSIKTESVTEAQNYLDLLEEESPNDPLRLSYRFRIQKLKHIPLAEQIQTLEQLKKEDYIERWAYELAKLYHKVGDTASCIRECGDIILWFGEGEYVEWAKILRGHLLGEIDIHELQEQQEALRRANEVRQEIGEKTEAEFDETDEMFTDCGNVEEVTAIVPEDGNSEDENTVFKAVAKMERPKEESKAMPEDESETELLMGQTEEAEARSEEEPETESSEGQTEEAEARSEEESEAESSKRRTEEAEEKPEEELEAESSEESAQVVTAEPTESEEKLEERKTEAIKQKMLQTERLRDEQVQRLERSALERDAVQYMEKFLRQNESRSTKEVATRELHRSRESQYQLQENGKLFRMLAENEMELEDILGNYARMDGVRKQLVRSLDIIFDGHKRVDNLIITGGRHCGKTTLAKKIAKLMYRFGELKTTKVALVDADRLNRIDIGKKQEALMDCCLIIEQAGKLKEQTVNRLVDMNPAFQGRTVVFLEDNRSAVNTLLRDNPSLNSVYNNRIHLPNEYKPDDLKGFAYEFLLDREYEIDIEAADELDHRICAVILQKSENPISDSIDIVKEAVRNAEKRTARKLASIAETGQYENADIMILHREDFTEFIR